MRYVDIWIKEKCNKCERKEKCKPYDVEMLLCVLNYVNQMKKREERNVATTTIN